MAVVDRNILRLAVYEFLHELTPRTVAINEALEIARRFSTYEATQFINGILDAIKRDLDRERPQDDDKLDRSEEAAPEAEAASEAHAAEESPKGEAPAGEAGDPAAEASAESDGEQARAVNRES
jgi:hypothetical protein